MEKKNELLKVKFIAVDDPEEIRAMEQGEGGWKEATVESQGLVPCTAPITGTVYRICSYGGLIDKYYPKAVVIRILGSKKGRLFFNTEGMMRAVIDLPDEEFEELLGLIAMDTYEISGVGD